MNDGHTEYPEDLTVFYSNVKPGRAQHLTAFLFSLAIVAIFFITVSFSDNEPHLLPGFVLGLVVSMLLCDIITAILLFAQFSISRFPSILVLANGYVFTFCILIGWTLSIPGVIIPGQPLIGGLQSAPGFYIAWRSGFTIFVISYAILKRTRVDKPIFGVSARTVIVSSFAATLALTVGIGLFCVIGEHFLPRIMADSVRYTSLYPYALGLSNSLLSVIALVLLWRRGLSSLDLWLMVVMFFYFMDLPLSYYPSPVRYTDGWYAVRLIAFVSSTLVLSLLLFEITSMYGSLMKAIVSSRREREARLVTGDAVAAMIAHEIRQPLTAMITRADTGFRLLNRSSPDLEKLKAAIKQISADGHRAGAIIERVRANFQSDVRVRALCDVNDLIDETLSFVRGDLQRHRIRVQAEPDPKRPQIVGDRIQLQQLLVNLVMNAIDSMKDQAEARSLSLTSEARLGGQIVISVADTGNGISPEDIDRVFDPFFTTKSSGMGMGLSICRSIVQAHGGELTVAQNSPTGTVFQITLRSGDNEAVQATNVQ